MKVITNNLTKKLLIVIIIILLFNVITPPTYSYGAFSGILTKPICYFFIRILDGINLTASALFCPEDTWKDIKDNIFDGEGLGDGTLDFGDLTDIQKSYYMALMSPDKIFRGQVKMLDANIFDAEETGVFSEIFNTQGSLVSGLKKTVSNIYVLLRNIAAVALLCLLIYTGIRIVLASNSIYEQIQWRKVLIDWVKALCLLIFIHFIMIGIFYISELLVETMRQSLGNDSLVAAIRWNFNNQSFLDETACILYLIMYAYVMYLTVLFLVAYFKRLVWVIILIIISPIVAVMYAVGNEKQIFQRWFKEFSLTVFIQPFHFLVYYVLLGVPLSLLAGGADASNFQLIGTNHSNIIVQLYALLSISMIKPAELFIRNLFGFSGSKIAQKASAESGKKTIDAGVKIAKKTVETGVKVAAIVATAGAAGAGTGTAGAGTGTMMPVNDLENLNNTEGLPEGESIGEDVTGEDITGENGEDNGGLNNEQGLPNKENEAAEKMNEAAEKMNEAAEKMNDSIDREIEVSDKDLKSAIPDSKETKYNKLKEKLEAAKNGPYGSSIDAIRDSFNEIRSTGSEFMDTFYVEGEGNKNPAIDARRKSFEEARKTRLDAFVNNKNNINFMIQEHGLLKGLENCKTQKERDEKEKAAQEAAKGRLKKAEPYLALGAIADVRVLDGLISSQEQTGRDPRTVLSDVGRDGKIDNVISNSININEMAQIISRRTGENIESPRVKEEAKTTMEQSKPYVESGIKNPEILYRLVQLENGLRRAKLSPNVVSTDKVKDMDKIIQKAFESNTKKITLPKTQQNESKVKEIENVMNKELKDRKELSKGSLGSGNK